MDTKQGTSNWEVDEALREVLDAIEQGSPLELETDVRSELDAFYRPYFERNHETGADWEEARGRILILACIVGAAATVFETMASSATGSTFPESVTTEWALAAAVFVSLSKACPPPDLSLGGFCPPQRELRDRGDATAALQNLGSALDALLEEREA